MLVRIIATRQLVLAGVNTPPGGELETEEEVAQDLEARGLATRWRPIKPKPAHPNKMHSPKERKTAF
jgi:hypothetical protein